MSLKKNSPKKPLLRKATSLLSAMLQQQTEEENKEEIRPRSLTEPIVKYLFCPLEIEQFQ